MPAEFKSDENAIDVKLMQKLARGDTSALATLIERHQQKVLSLAMRTLAGHDQIEDVAQDVFVKVYQAAENYKPDAKFTTWLYRIVINRCLDLRRKMKNRPVQMDFSPPPLDDRSGDNWLEKTEQAKIVRDVVNDLPERQRIAVILHRFQGLSHKEVAQSTGWSVSAVESLLNRAYSNLRHRLAKIVSVD